MNDITPVPASRSAEEMAGLKNITMVIYGLQALSFLYGVTALVGIVINYIKRDNTQLLHSSL